MNLGASITSGLRAARLWPAFLFLVVAMLSGCGENASAANCGSNVANVSGSDITRSQYDLLLGYTLGFYERGNPESRWYGKKLCQTAALSSACDAIKQSLLQRMIDQQIVSDYAAAHNLIPTGADWSRALRREARIVRATGGQAAFATYLSRVGTDQAQFRFLESQQIETDKVIQAMGVTRFHAWLDGQEHARSVQRCSGQL